MCLGCSWDGGVVIEKLPASHMKIYLPIGGAGTKWQQVAANRYFDSTIDAVKSCLVCATKGGHITVGPGAHERKEKGRCWLIQNSRLLRGLAKTITGCAGSELALPSNQVEAGVMIRPVPLQCTSSTVPESAARSPATHWHRWRREPGK
jgi:hypothetical protein